MTLGSFFDALPADAAALADTGSTQTADWKSTEERDFDFLPRNVAVMLDPATSAMTAPLKGPRQTSLQILQLLQRESVL